MNYIFKTAAIMFFKLYETYASNLFKIPQEILQSSSLHVLKTLLWVLSAVSQVHFNYIAQNQVINSV